MKFSIKENMPAAFFLMVLILYAGPSFAQVESLSYTGKLPLTRKTIPWGRDPFIPLLRNMAAVPDLKLTAIFYNPSRPSAIINDMIVYRGSVIKGQKVIDIGKTHVILQTESGTVKLEMAGIPELPDGVSK